MPKVTIKGKKIKLPYTKAGKKLAIKLRKKKKKNPGCITGDQEYDSNGGGGEQQGSEGG